MRLDEAASGGVQDKREVDRSDGNEMGRIEETELRAVGVIDDEPSSC